MTTALLHLADEPNGPCGAMADADQLKIQTTLGAAATLFEESEAAILTDGHTFAVRRGAEALSYLEGLLEQAVALQEAALGLTQTGAPIRPSAFAARYAATVTKLGVGGANPNAMFTGMMATNQLGEMGYARSPQAWTRPGRVPCSTTRLRRRHASRPRFDPRRRRDGGLEAAGQSSVRSVPSPAERVRGRGVRAAALRTTFDQRVTAWVRFVPFVWRACGRVEMSL